MHFHFLLAFAFLLPSALAAISTIVVTASAPTPVPTSPSYTSDSAFELAILTAHNLYRSQHNASALHWNASLATYASNWANDCKFKHSGGPDGENLAAGYANATASVDAWGEERKLYSFIKQGFSEETGHFTQVVWKGTAMVGCGRVECDGKGDTPGW
ncbi:MAG: hypothetical protein M1812_004667 [Candelaria pacifica]|nr:MAG: hypothetical protein M1812_004667 [Candelaria pacifica]